MSKKIKITKLFFVLLLVLAFGTPHAFAQFSALTGQPVSQTLTFNGSSGASANQNSSGANNLTIGANGNAVSNANLGSSGITLAPAIDERLSFGQGGENVRMLQVFLAGDSNANVSNNINITGSFDASTRAAVRAFQKAHGLPQVGKVGPRTLRAIANEFANRNIAFMTDAQGHVNVCVHVPPGHTIAPGYLRKIGNSPIVPSCQDLPGGIANNPNNSNQGAFRISGVTNAGGNIFWTTNVPTTAQINFGTTTSYGQQTTLNSNLSGVHVQALTGLQPNTTYHYQVVSRDAQGNVVMSGDNTFTTGTDVSGPVLSNIAVTGLTSNGATITWNANENSTAIINYGINGTFSNSLRSSNTQSGNQSINLTGLTPGANYTYKIFSVDANGNVTLSGDLNFTTPTTTSGNGMGGTIDLGTDTSGPVFSDLRVSNITGTGASLTWNTNENATATINYGTSASYGNTAVFNTSNMSGSTNLSGLQPNTTYHFRVTFRDASGNTSTSSDTIFTTGSSTGTNNNTNTGTNGSSMINGIQVSNLTNNSATLTWSTNANTTSRIFYSTFPNINTNTALSVSGSGSTSAHTMDLHDLSANTTYYFKIESTDSNMNIYTSDEGVFLTHL